MKRVYCVILLLLMLLNLCSCGALQDGKRAELLVGFDRTVITPKESVPLAGYGNTTKRMSKEILDELYVTCVAITDAEENTVLLLSHDLISSSQHDLTRTSISVATGVPKERIYVAGTHTHSAPDQLSKLDVMTDYRALYLKCAVNTAKAAMEDRSPATVQIGSGETEGLNFVRHYLMNDGSYAGDNFGDWSSGIKDHAEPNDPQLQVIRFLRKENKNILMVNWQVHPKLTGGNTKYDVSSDFVGYTRDYVESQTGDLMIYFTGAAGNQNPNSRIPEETAPTDVLDYSKQVGQVVLRVTENMTPVEIGTIRTKQTIYDAKVDLVMQDKLSEAKEVQELYKEKGREEANVLARQYGFSSVYHSNAVINRSSYGKSQKVEVNAIGIGSIGFVTASYEMFASHGAAIKANSPYAATFVITCCNGGNGYIPTQAAHEYGCYESHTGRFIPGTGEELVKVLTESLSQLKS